MSYKPACDFSGFYQNSGFSEKKKTVEICVEMMQNLGGWHRDSRKVQRWLNILFIIQYFPGFGNCILQFSNQIFFSVPSVLDPPGYSVLSYSF